MLLLIDNYDSFTYNLAQAFQMLGLDVKVQRSDSLSIEDCLRLHPSHLVIGPGPGHPGQAGISKELILYFAGRFPILGVCLGHQCLAEAYGSKIVRALKPMHGKLSNIYHNSQGVFAGLPHPFEATRYHSLIVDKSSLPHCLEITAETAQGEIMALRHRRHLCLESVQFHPESVMTLHGMTLLKNFIDYSIQEGGL
jgi:anthranilate synthase/aminodeoxychorismate synthase-like glutamine amidotransferase